MAKQSKIPNGQLIFTLVAFVLATVNLVWDISPYLRGNSHAGQFGFFRAFEHLDIWRYTGGGMMLVALAIHYFRLWCGVAFIDYDPTFNAAREKVPDKKRKDHLDTALRIVLLLTIGLYVKALKEWPAAGVVVLGAQVLVVAAYNVLFFREYYILDEQRAANRWIAVGDSAFIIFVGWLSVAYFYDGVAGSRFESLELILPAFLGAYSAIFVGEFFAYYIQPLGAAAKQLGDILSPSRETEDV